VSNAIRYDSLLVRALARELHDAFSGVPLEGIWLDRERLRVTIRGRGRRRSDTGPSLLWQLHPSNGHLTAAPEEPGGSRIPLPAPAIVHAVTSPHDERIVILELRSSDAPAGVTRRVAIELMTNQWNAVALSADDRITAILRERATQERTLRVGVGYVPPRQSHRAGGAAPLSLDQWRDMLRDVEPAERLRALPRLAAYASPSNAGWILGTAAINPDEDALTRAWRRYHALTGSELEAVLLQEESGWQPYVRVVDGGAVGEAQPSLVAAFAEAADRSAAAPVGGVTMEEALDAVARRMETVQKRMERLRAERDGSVEEAQRLRTQAAVLLSQLHAVRRGSESVELPDFSGEPLAITLDPQLSPADNANRMYDTARRRERAAARIPGLLQRAEDELLDLESLAARVRDGSVSAEELARLQRTQPAPGREVPRLPYREYRTSRGLEVRVGRGSKANDDLTFRHSSPTDIWLHARDVAGAHVILRWSRADENPPAADIAEAATLAALYSRARTSGTVPVDWTRRKHVRKPRKAGPGLVVPERVRTVFVAPDAALEERLRVT
jgi:predicted ribosome quality control (RQC) complex YloA/Tae2 family protein